LGRHRGGTKGRVIRAVLTAALLFFVCTGLANTEITFKVLPAYEFVEVTRVVDGDTIKVILDGSQETVRLVGVDTAESVHPNHSKNTLEGVTASNYTKKQLEGKRVLLVFSEPKQDFFGRYLAYVYLVDTSSYPAKLICFNWMLIENGYSDIYTKYKFSFKEEFAESF